MELRCFDHFTFIIMNYNLFNFSKNFLKILNREFRFIFILQTIYNCENIIFWKIFPLNETYIIEYGHCINNTAMVQTKLSSKSFFNNLMSYRYSRT